MGHSTRAAFLRFCAGVVALSVLGAGCTNAPDAATVAASKRVDLNVWGVEDDFDAYNAIFTDYHKIHPNIFINFQRFRLEEYENSLLNAWAEDRGPDIFLIHNTWVGKYMPKIAPMPPTTHVAVQVVVGTIKKEVQYQLVDQPTMTIRAFKTDFPDVVPADMLKTVNVSTQSDKTNFQQRIVAMPLSVDTLGLYVNKDLLNVAGITTIPETWDTFQAAVKKLVKTDKTGEILQAGAALGTGANIERSPDIISALMMQNGADMAAADGTPLFATIPQKLQGQRDVPPSFQALGFYSDFANPGKEVYTWNAKQPNSLDAFLQGKVAFFLGYSYDLPVIRARAPKLNLAIAKLPQIAGNPEANFANYWAWTVSKKSKNIDVSWNLIDFMRGPDEAKKYLDFTKRPAALKALLNGQMDDENVGVFAAQVLTSQSWYRGSDPQAADNAFVEMLENVAASGGDPNVIRDSVRTASDKVSQTITF